MNNNLPILSENLINSETKILSNLEASNKNYINKPTMLNNYTSDLLYILGIILFLIIAYLSYYFYIKYRKNK